jgi:nucleoside-diphosphate-sugar epimerase
VAAARACCDIARATVAVLQAPRELVHDQAVNVGGDRENYRVRELAEIAREAVGGCEVEFAGRGDPDPRSYRVDFAKLGRMFPAFELEWTAERGAAELVEAYSRVGLTFSDFEGDRYTRLRRLKRLLETGALDDSLRWEEEPGL